MSMGQYFVVYIENHVHITTGYPKIEDLCLPHKKITTIILK